jgi:hypothetical protein
MKGQLVNHRHQADARAQCGDAQSLAQLVVAQTNAAARSATKGPC